MQLLVLSAASQSAAAKLAKNLEEYIRRGVECEKSILLEDIAHTLYSHRSALAWRLFFTTSTVDDLLAQIEANDRHPQKRATNPKIGFVFTGQGPQWAGMALDLIEVYSVFRDSIIQAEQCLKILGAPWNLRGMPRLSLCAQRNWIVGSSNPHILLAFAKWLCPFSLVLLRLRNTAERC